MHSIVFPFFRVKISIKASDMLPEKKYWAHSYSYVCGLCGACVDFCASEAQRERKKIPTKVSVLFYVSSHRATFEVYFPSTVFDMGTLIRCDKLNWSYTGKLKCHSSKEEVQNRCVVMISKPNYLLVPLTWRSGCLASCGKVFCYLYFCQVTLEKRLIVIVAI